MAYIFKIHQRRDTDAALACFGGFCHGPPDRTGLAMYCSPAASCQLGISALEYFASKPPFDCRQILRSALHPKSIRADNAAPRLYNEDRRWKRVKKIRELLARPGKKFRDTVEAQPVADGEIKLLANLHAAEITAAEHADPFH